MFTPTVYVILIYITLCIWHLCISKSLPLTAPPIKNAKTHPCEETQLLTPEMETTAQLPARQG